MFLDFKYSYKRLYQFIQLLILSTLFLSCQTIDKPTGALGSKKKISIPKWSGQSNKIIKNRKITNTKKIYPITKKKKITRTKKLPPVKKTIARKKPGQTKRVTKRSKPATKTTISKPAKKNVVSNIPKIIPSGAKKYYSGISTNKKIVALTFDDGPHPRNTGRLLNILAERNIKATFYVIGKNVKLYPHLVKRMKAEGHEVGNHTYNHLNLAKVSNEKLNSQLTKTAELIKDTIGVYPKTMRPPFGASNSSIRTKIFENFGYPTILWTVDPFDWKRPGVSVVKQRIVSKARNGAIILAHDIHKPTIDAMPGTLDALLAKGFQFVTVTQLISQDGS